jgi:hypothetical protein
MRHRTHVRLTVGLIALAVCGFTMLGSGCSSLTGSSGESTQTPAANPLIPADTARNTIGNANNAVNELQNQVNQTP